MISRKGTRKSLAASGVAKILREEGKGPVVTAGTVVSGLERMFIWSSLQISFSGGPGALAKPLFDPFVGVGVLGDVGNDRDRIRAGCKNLVRLLEPDAADRDQGKGADALLPLGDLRNALRREAHRLQRGRKDRTERDVIGVGGKRGLKLGVVMG